MANRVQRISNCLWFDDQAEAAVEFYTSIFEDSRVVQTTRYTPEGAQVSKKREGSIMTIVFELAGQEFTALNGGPTFKFNEAVSLMVTCETQAELDHYWSRLNEGGDPKAQQCGWLKDKFGVSWQVTPRVLQDLITDPDPERARRATKAMLGMKKLDIAALCKAADGK
jgi:predicted 3-demethylubiquinone-9 3-methyltransferase (glyoxalase superfamily)